MYFTWYLSIVMKTFKDGLPCKSKWSTLNMCHSSWRHLKTVYQIKRSDRYQVYFTWYLSLVMKTFNPQVTNWGPRGPQHSIGVCYVGAMQYFFMVFYEFVTWISLTVYIYWKPVLLFRLFFKCKISSGVPQDPSFSNAIHEIRRKSTRNEKLNHDKLAAFRDIWTLFTAQVTTFFVPGPYLCVDEQLMAYYGRCNFSTWSPYL